MIGRRMHWSGECKDDIPGFRLRRCSDSKAVICETVVKTSAQWVADRSIQYLPVSHIHDNARKERRRKRTGGKYPSCQLHGRHQSIVGCYRNQHFQHTSTFPTK